MQHVPSPGHSASVFISSQKKASNRLTHSPLHCFDGFGDFVIGFVVLYIELVVCGRIVVVLETFLFGMIRFDGILSPYASLDTQQRSPGLHKSSVVRIASQ